MTLTDYVKMKEFLREHDALTCTMQTIEDELLRLREEQRMPYGILFGHGVTTSKECCLSPKCAAQIKILLIDDLEEALAHKKNELAERKFQP